MIVASTHATNKCLFKQMPFDPVADFEPVVFTHIVPLLLAVHPSVPAKTESIARAARRNASPTTSRPRLPSGAR